MKAASGEAIQFLTEVLNLTFESGFVSSGDGYAIDVVCHDETFRERSGFWHQELQDYFRVSPRGVDERAFQAICRCDRR